MSRNIGFALLSVLLASSVSFAQTGESRLTEDASADNFRRVNFKLAPLSALVGIAEGGIDVAVSERVSLGVYGSSLFNDGPLKNAIDGETTRDMDDFELSFNQYGFRVDVGLTGGVMSDTWYVSPFIKQMNIEVEDTLLNDRASGDLTLAGAGVGYRWMWDHFNISLGAVLTTPLEEEYRVDDGSEVDEDDLDSVGTLAGLDFNFGFAF